MMRVSLVCCLRVDRVGRLAHLLKFTDDEGLLDLLPQGGSCRASSPPAEVH